MAVQSELGAESRARAYNLDHIRSQFPILAREVYPGVVLTYLDNAATSQKPGVVIEALTEHYSRHVSNVHRGLHRLAEEATEAYEAAREQVARLIHAPAPAQVIFTHGTTEGINAVASSLARSRLRSGDEILLTQMEHHSNLVPWQQAARYTGATVRFVPITEDGLLDLEQLGGMLSRNTKVVAFTALSNVLGTLNPVRQIADMAHEVNALVLVDGAQSVPHLACDVAAWDCDFLAFSGHKMCGPDGVGVLYGRTELLGTLPPFLVGGEMVRRVGWDGAQWNELPWKFEAGTPPIAAAIGLGAAVRFLQHVGMDAIRAHDAELVDYAWRRLQDLNGIALLGPPPPHRAALVSFTLDGIHPHDLAQLLDRHGVAIRAGHHCAQPLHERLGIVASARASFYLYNTTEEVDRLVDAIEQAQRLLLRGKG